MGYEQINDSLKLISCHSARTLNVQDRYGIEVGKPRQPADPARRKRFRCGAPPGAGALFHSPRQVIAETRPAQTSSIWHGAEPIDFRR